MSLTALASLATADCSTSATAGPADTPALVVMQDSMRRHAGLNALNIVLGVEYKISDNLKAYASVRQFGLVSDDARAVIKASSAPQAKRDLTVATVGVAVSF